MRRPFPGSFTGESADTELLQLASAVLAHLAIGGSILTAMETGQSGSFLAPHCQKIEADAATPTANHHNYRSKNYQRRQPAEGTVEEVVIPHAEPRLMLWRILWLLSFRVCLASSAGRKPCSNFSQKEDLVNSIAVRLCRVPAEGRSKLSND